MVIAKTPHPIPKMGITKIVSCEITDDIANIEIEILTGRTHQIRYHLSKHGLPIIGDYLYMGKSTYNEEDSMHLQAYRLSFIDINGEKIDVQCKKSW
jgi:23S rRNA-/tRNA-specific pseudouridylate synthase